MMSVLIIVIFLVFIYLAIRPRRPRNSVEHEISILKQNEEYDTGFTKEEIDTFLSKEEMEILNLTRDDVVKILKERRDNKLKAIRTEGKMNRKSQYLEKMATKYKHLQILDTSEGDKFYVYEYTVNKKVIYIGKGTTFGRSGYDVKSFKFYRAIDIHAHKECIPYTKKIKIKILKGFENEKDAFKYESKLIAHYGIDNLLNKRH